MTLPPMELLPTTPAGSQTGSYWEESTVASPRDTLTEQLRQALDLSDQQLVVCRLQEESASIRAGLDNLLQTAEEETASIRAGLDGLVQTADSRELVIRILAEWRRITALWQQRCEQGRWVCLPGSDPDWISKNWYTLSV